MKTASRIILVAMLAAFLIGCGEGKRESQQVTPPSSAEAATEQAPPQDFVGVDKEPAIIKKVEPVYPELAKKAGLEGKVWVKIWVDTEGKPKQVTILKSDAEIFNQVTIDAAKQFVFTPAYVKDKPVSVWVSVPFKYKLADKDSTQSSKAISKPASPTEASFMKGYIAAKEESLSALEKEAGSARAGGTPDSALQRKIQRAKGELQALKDALRAMQGAK